MRVRGIARALSAVAVVAATVGGSAVAAGAADGSDSIGVQAVSYRWGGVSNASPQPADAGGLDAAATVSFNDGTGWQYAQSVRFQASGEHLFVKDHLVDGRTAWGVLIDVETGRYYFLRDANVDNTTADLNLSFAEGNRIRVFTCMGTATDYDYWGCSPIYSGVA